MKKLVNTYYCVFLMIGFGSFTTPKLNFCNFSKDRNQISSSTSFLIGFLFDFDRFLGFLDRSMCFQSEYMCFSTSGGVTVTAAMVVVVTVCVCVEIDVCVFEYKT